jgi:type IV pilus assembly protein PilM
MGFLPTSLGLRPRLAIEIRAEGVVAARSDEAQALVSAVSSKSWSAGMLAEGLKQGNGDARRSTVAAIRQALEAVALKERQATLILPDSAVRVLLLDFDALPAKSAEALPIVRFRLKKLLPFDAEDAVVSYQVMSQERGAVRVLAAAVPKTVLSDFEALVREAGFEPGAVLPSTLAACAGLEEEVSATLLVNASESGVTTAIVQGGRLLLHRTVDLEADDLEEKVTSARAASDIAVVVPAELLANPAESTLPLVDPAHSAGEWARQAPLSGYGVIDDSHFDADEAPRGAISLDPVPGANDFAGRPELERVPDPNGAKLAGPGKLIADREIVQAISVAAAYFEDTLGAAPQVIVAAGTYGVAALAEMLRRTGFSEQELRVTEAVKSAMLTDGATTVRIELGWLAGVRGALRS